MWEHLWTKKDPPPEYIDMLLMDRFGWTWQELRDTPENVIRRILVMWSAETARHAPRK